MFLFFLVPKKHGGFFGSSFSPPRPWSWCSFVHTTFGWAAPPAPVARPQAVHPAIATCPSPWWCSCSPARHGLQWVSKRRQYILERRLDNKRFWWAKEMVEKNDKEIPIQKKETCVAYSNSSTVWPSASVFPSKTRPNVSACLFVQGSIDGHSFVQLQQCEVVVVVYILLIERMKKDSLHPSLHRVVIIGQFLSTSRSILASSTALGSSLSIYHFKQMSCLFRPKKMWTFGFGPTKQKDWLLVSSKCIQESLRLLE